MIHRGPDAAGDWWSGDRRVGLAHRRLSIVDVTSAGHQPMRNDARGLATVFNGEIYNFRELRVDLEKRGYPFRSSSDTEVLLAAYDRWGSKFVSRLNGMFSFALYDAKRRIVLFARDRAGEKPLFYRLADGELWFASELKALLTDPSLPRRIDPEALDCYLAMGFVPGERCILDGFHKLQPAHAMEFNLDTGRLHIWRYWQEPDAPPEPSSNPIDHVALLDELEGLLEDAVRRQLVADVPVGILLSGGVDSSLIAAMAARATHQVKTFTIGFPGHRKLDESEHARMIARHFGTKHTELVAQPATADLLPRLARQFDEPLTDSSMIPTFLVCQLVRQQCTVALGGDGGDELFGGYSHHSRLLWMKERLGHIPLSFRRAISIGAGCLLPVGLKGRNWLQGLGTDLATGLPLIASYFDAATRRQLMSHSGRWHSVSESLANTRMPKHTDLLQRATRMDFRQYLADDILVKIDRASMLNSLEVRSPLLDYRLIEFAFGRVPTSLKATPHERKILLKRLAARVLPSTFDLQRKQGFSVPLTDWLKTGVFREMFRGVLMDSQSIFNRQAVDALWRGQDWGCNNGERLFALTLFELWRREYDATL